VIAVMKLRVLVVGVAFVEMVVMIVERSGGRVGWQEGGSVVSRKWWKLAGGVISG
jgi:hypothetical protein